MKIRFEGDVESLREGILLLQEEMDLQPVFAPEEASGLPPAPEKAADLTVKAVQGSGEELDIAYEAAAGKAVIIYGKKIGFFRGLDLLAAHLKKEPEADFSCHEHMYFTMNGPMYDVSQGNAVINQETVYRLLRFMARMGLDMLMLYCEDSYQVKEEPYFGYMRGKYTEEDMKAIDDYAYALGIEVIPCIQTLAHMANTFRWNGVYGDIAEDGECLFVGEEKTYEFVRRLIETASRPFRTKRIHIGMDEAWQLGLGKYLRKHGYTEKTKIMQDHLARVMEIVRDLGLEPMMWADMFFRAITPRGEYYVPEDFVIPEESRRAVPEDMELVYWDYYHFDEPTYAHHIDKHRALCSDPSKTIFAGGIWTWLGMGADWPITFESMEPALMACKKKNVREVFATVWGDCGTECNILATLPGLAFFAEHGWNEAPSLEQIAARFEAVTDARWQDFMVFSDIDYIPGTEKESHSKYSPSKFLMYQDVLEGLFDANIRGRGIEEHYRSLTERYRESLERNASFNDLMKFYYLTSRVLEIKAELGIHLTDAYLKKDRAALHEIRETVIPELCERVKELKSFHRDLWSDTYQVFGWDIMDLRYGGILSRLETASYRIGKYLAGDERALAELEEPRLPYNGVEGIPIYTNKYEDISSPSTTAR